MSEKEIEQKEIVGIVKWFSSERGYGYITNKNNEDLYFGVKDIIGADLPDNGDQVKFIEYSGKEGSNAAKSVIITDKKNPALKQVKCGGCGRSVEPKPWYYGGSDYTTVAVDLMCPFCAHVIVKTGGGFNKFAKTILIVFSTALVLVMYKLS